ncbi:MAG: hypothetical protein QW715_00710, partial [Thermoplasmata archaeon]
SGSGRESLNPSDYIYIFIRYFFLLLKYLIKILIEKIGPIIILVEYFNKKANQYDIFVFFM